MGPAIAVANYWKKLVYQIKGNGKVFAGDRIGSNKHQRIPKGQSKIDNPKNLATQGTQNEEKQNKNNTTQYVLDTTIPEQTQITYAPHHELNKV